LKRDAGWPTWEHNAERRVLLRADGRDADVDDERARVVVRADAQIVGLDVPVHDACRGGGCNATVVGNESTPMLRGIASLTCGVHGGERVQQAAE